MNKISIICLGVRDMEKSLKFYRDDLGFQTEEKDNNPKVVFFNTPGTKFELYPLDLLIEDFGGDADTMSINGFSGITLAYNATSREEVHEIIELVRKAGGTVVKEPQDVFWGGYHAYFRDVDGYYWEVAWGPRFKYDKDRMLIF